MVAELLPVLEEWYEQAKAAKVAEDADSEVSPEELERLRALGYVQ